MSQHQLHVHIASIAETFYSGEVDAVTVPGSAGEMTLMANHEPLITTLRSGTISIRTGTEKKNINVMHGVLEVSGNTAHILL
jgi:F-type H+-transporting ATPase subunit epsilon